MFNYNSIKIIVVTTMQSFWNVTCYGSFISNTVTHDFTRIFQF